ncbi:TPA: hypothetical protein DIT45_04350 [Candidatus Acetothermia bacterium]|nr:hypothetical protein [Candidatus Acetothermia bacterium]
MPINARLLGLLGGLLAGLLLVLVGWRILLILLAFALAGYLVGVYLESREGVIRRLQELITRLFRS